MLLGTKRNSRNIAKVRPFYGKRTSLNQRIAAKSLKCLLPTFNKIINTDLNIKKAKKHNVYHLSLWYIAERRKRCRIIYEKLLFGENFLNVVTINEAWVYLNDCNTNRFICYHQRGEKNIITRMYIENFLFETSRIIALICFVQPKVHI